MTGRRWDDVLVLLMAALAAGVWLHVAFSCASALGGQFADVGPWPLP